MRRKYDLRNKRNFIIILIVAVAVIGIFSLFIYQYKRSSKIEYAIDVGSIVQDTDKNSINVDEDATLKMRWNGNYYLIYQDKKINLSKNVIVYNTVTGSINLYGKFYEIQDDGNVSISEDETILSNTTNTKFYKIGDREYLLIDRQIVSDDRSIETSNYMLVELDRMGNAKLSNNKLNMKTINPTILVTSEYSFDIANEILKYDDLSIDLKKIIGSSNQYTPKDDKATTNNTTDSSTSSGDSTIAGNFSGSNGIYSGTNNSGVINNASTGEISNIEELKNKTKMTSIIRAQEGLTQIDIDYVIYDPYNEYKSVYVEVIKLGVIEVVHLSKTDTHIVFDNLIPNTEYKFNFIYTTANSETGEIVTTTFDSMSLTTKMPVYSISVHKISNVNNMLTYRVNLQEGYLINKVNVILSFNYHEINVETGEVTTKSARIPSSVNVSSSDKTVTGSISLAGYNIDNNTLMTLSIDSVSVNEEKINVSSVYTFRVGR